MKKFAWERTLILLLNFVAWGVVVWALAKCMR